MRVVVNTQLNVRQYATAVCICMYMCNGILLYCYMPTQMPVEKTLGTVRSWVAQGSKRRIIERADTFVYIPIIEVLRRMLQNDAVYEQVL